MSNKKPVSGKILPYTKDKAPEYYLNPLKGLKLV
jgi:hypothetical protein